MKKYLFILLLFCCADTYSQSLSLQELSNITTLAPDQISYLLATKKFKLQYGEQVKGFVVTHYQSNSRVNKLESVITGAGYKTISGDVLQTVTYTTSDPQNIINLVNQTKAAGLNLSFQGADAANNIYIYDSYLYHMVVHLSFNQEFGIITISQKMPPG